MFFYLSSFINQRVSKSRFLLILMVFAGFEGGYWHHTQKLFAQDPAVESETVQSTATQTTAQGTAEQEATTQSSLSRPAHRTPVGLAFSPDDTEALTQTIANLEAEEAKTSDSLTSEGETIPEFSVDNPFKDIASTHALGVVATSITATVTLSTTTTASATTDTTSAITSEAATTTDTTATTVIKDHVTTSSVDEDEPSTDIAAADTASSVTLLPIKADTPKPYDPNAPLPDVFSSSEEAIQMIRQALGNYDYERVLILVGMAHQQFPQESARFAAFEAIAQRQNAPDTSSTDSVFPHMKQTALPPLLIEPLKVSPTPKIIPPASLMGDTASGSTSIVGSLFASLIEYKMLVGIVIGVIILLIVLLMILRRRATSVEDEVQDVERSFDDSIDPLAALGNDDYRLTPPTSPSVSTLDPMDPLSFTTTADEAFDAAIDPLASPAAVEAMQETQLDDMSPQLSESTSPFDDLFGVSPKEEPHDTEKFNLEVNEATPPPPLPSSANVDLSETLNPEPPSVDISDAFNFDFDTSSSESSTPVSMKESDDFQPMEFVEDEEPVLTEREPTPPLIDPSPSSDEPNPFDSFFASIGGESPAQPFPSSSEENIDASAPFSFSFEGFGEASSTTDAGNSVYDKELKEGKTAFEAENWDEAVRHLSVAAALNPEVFEVKEMLREARRRREAQIG